MLHSLNEIRRFEIVAGDDSIGRTSDFFFDDRGWTIRYFVVDTGWLFGRKVPVASDAIQSFDAKRSTICVSLTNQEIEESLGVGTDLPVSRQEEFSLRDYYGWPKYWEIYPSGVGVAPLLPTKPGREPIEPMAVSTPDAEKSHAGDPNLRSAREATGYRMEADDGEIGHVEVFLLEEDSWAVRYIVVDTRSWLPGRKLLVSPGWAKGIDWDSRRLVVNRDRDEIKDSPLYDLSQRIDRASESAIHNYFRRQPYR